MMSALLGIADEQIEEEKDAKLSWDVNKIGGIPNWMVLGPSSYPTCQICHNLQYMVIQIYCPLEKSLYHRTLYVFACVQSDCWDNVLSWKVYRSQCIDKEPEQNTVMSEKEKETSDGWGEEEWCSDATDWGVEDELSPEIMASLKKEKYNEDLKVIEEKAFNVDITVEEYPQNATASRFLDDTKIPHFIPRYIFVLQEPSENTTVETDNYIQGLINEYEKNQGAIEDPVDEKMEFVGESYEKTGPSYEDSEFHKYQKRVSRTPSQCLRYQWNGEPLLMTSKTKLSTDLDSIPDCPRCHSKRICELQLLSSISWFLREKNDPSAKEPEQEIDDYTWEDGEICARQERIDFGSVPLLTDTRLEFGSVLVYTCSSSCWSSSEDYGTLVDEFVVVQPDPDRYISAKGK